MEESKHTYFIAALSWCQPFIYIKIPLLGQHVLGVRVPVRGILIGVIIKSIHHFG